MYATDGDKSFLRHHSASASEFSAHPELASGRISVYGQPFLSLSNIAMLGETLSQEKKATSLLHLNIPIVYMMSTLTLRAHS